MKEKENVLFVVYRAEWWGCLDSLCRQECLNENTLVYVMPIPRYERELGTTKINYNKVHFHPEQIEGELPQGAVLADYRTFSMAQGFDRIYIHNPYDNTYFVDSVEPKYYSWNLKPYAQKLIYVPHIFYIDSIPQEVVDSPVCEHMDVIYLADKKARYSLDVQYDYKAEIVPSGIPEYLERLEEGLKGGTQKGEGRKADQQGGGAAKNQEVRRGGQGTRKRLLCCLSYDNLYYGSEKLIQKLRDVFEYLRTRKDILLVFHPDEDIRMRFPWLDEPIRKKYAEAVAYFQKKRVGIYDEGTDLYRAAAEADGILSFGHVMDSLFSVQGKYVLHLDSVSRPIPSDEIRCIPSLWTVTAVEEENEIELWFVPERTKLICRMVFPKISKEAYGRKGIQNKGKKAGKKQEVRPQVEIVAEVPNEECRIINYINITKMENTLYLSPYGTGGIGKYDLKSGRFSERCLPGADGNCVTGTFLYGKYLYMIPRMYPGIIKYDTETDEIEIFDEWIEQLEHYVMPEYRQEPYFIWAVKREKNMLYMASSKCDVWMTFDMDNDVWQMKRMNLDGRCFIDMVKRNEWVWLFPWRGDEMILWNSVTNESRVIYQPADKEEMSAPYEFGLDTGSHIAIFPREEDNILLISENRNGKQSMDKAEHHVKLSGKIPCRKKDYLSEYQRERKLGYQFVRKMKNGTILAYEYYDGAFLILNQELEIVEKYDCRLPLEVIRQQQSNIWEKEQCRDGFDGVIDERYSLPAAIDYFTDRGSVDRNDIKRHYQENFNRCYCL